MFFSSSNMFARHSILSGLAIAFALLLSVTVANAQRTSGTNSTGTEGNEEIAGRVFFPPGDKSSARPVVKLQSLSSPELTGVTDRDGRFRFTTLRPDQYTVIVEAGDEYERATETISIGNSGAVPAQGNPWSMAIPLTYQVEIYLKPKRSNANGQPASSNTAFANVPLPAKDLFQQALENERTGKKAMAIEQLKKVIVQAPRFTLAYNELAMQYLKAGHAEQAIETLKKALAFSPDDFTLRLNYGIALLNRKDYPAAETELRLANEKGHADSPAALYYLGLALMSQRKFDGAESAFESVVKNGGARIALAHKYLGGLYWRDKRNGEAADELETYLKLEPKAPDAAEIRGTIGELRRKLTEVPDLDK